MKKNSEIFRLIIVSFLMIAIAFLPNELDAKKKRKAKKPKVYPPPSHVFVQDTTLSDAVYYKRIIITMDGNKHDVHILQANLENSSAEIKVMKAANNVSELQKLTDLIRYNDSVNNSITYGAVNANFWRAYNNYPIGPTLVDGEYVEMATYKEWSSMFVSTDGEPFIDNFKTCGKVSFKNLRQFDIRAVNHRKDSLGIVLYNRFGGDVIPYINSKKNEQLADAALDSLAGVDFEADSTDAIFDADEYHKELVEISRANSVEYKLRKIRLKYLSDPAVNKNVYCRVESILDSGSAEMPFRGCIISFGSDFVNKLPQRGDTILIRFETDKLSDKIFVSAVSGTPRLIRNGIVGHEAQKEGSRGRRFINSILPRTAIGYDKDKKKMFIVAVKANLNDKTNGANLAQLAKIMKYIGCYNAMNLDGGGSTVMILGGKNILNEETPHTSRRISVGIGFGSGFSIEKMFINGKSSSLP